VYTIFQDYLLKQGDVLYMPLKTQIKGLEKNIGICSNSTQLRGVIFFYLNLTYNARLLYFFILSLYFNKYKLYILLFHKFYNATAPSWTDLSYTIYNDYYTK